LPFGAPLAHGRTLVMLVKVQVEAVHIFPEDVQYSVTEALRYF